VALSTVHRVKGREWPRVVVAGVTAGLLPHRLAADEEEERRVLHVAITRARDKVMVLGDATRPSAFLGELAGVAPKRTQRAEPARERVPSGQVSSPRERRPGGRAATGAPLTGAAAVLEEMLKAWRLERSRADGVPAYVVASDATVREIARGAPASLAELSRVKGIGPAKLQRYGDEILTLVGARDKPDTSHNPDNPDNPDMA
jgi:DNA helicase-2/ATP-dependent DNA helicase PcrA